MRGEPLPVSLVQVPPRLHPRPQLLLLPGGTSQDARGRQGHRECVTCLGCSGLMSACQSRKPSLPPVPPFPSSASLPSPSAGVSSPLCSARPPGTCSLPPTHRRECVTSESHHELLAPKVWEGWKHCSCISPRRERGYLPEAAEIWGGFRAFGHGVGRFQLCLEHLWGFVGLVPNGKCIQLPPDEARGCLMATD